MKHTRIRTWQRALVALAAVAAVATFATNWALRAQPHGGTALAEAEKLPPGAKVVKIEVLPGQIDLKHRFDYRQLLLTGVLASGETLDVTRLARLEQAVPAVQLRHPEGAVHDIGSADELAVKKVSGDVLERQHPSLPAPLVPDPALETMRDRNSSSHFLAAARIGRMGCPAGGRQGAHRCETRV